MKQYNKIFIEHYSKYPLMLPRDFFKLIYQNSHGPHHLNQETLRLNYYNELEHIKKEPIIKYEEIGNDYYRVYLNPNWDNNIKLLVFNAFLESNLNYQPNRKLLEDELILLENMIKDKVINIDYNLFVNSLIEYRNMGYGALSHSNQYKLNYDPHYVVIYGKFLKSIFNQL